MSASSVDDNSKVPAGSLKGFLSAYAALSFRHHFIVGCVFMMILAAIKFLISISQPEGIWWDALNTLNLFVVLSTLMYGAIFFSQVMASVCARVAEMLFPGDKASATGSVLGVLLSALMILILAPYVLDIIWRL